MALAVGIGLLGGEALVAIYPAACKTKIWLMVAYAVIVYPALIIALIWFLLVVLQIKIA